MAAHYFKRFMWWLGYRRVLYLPSIYAPGLGLSDFWRWEYAPRSERRDYTQRNAP